jgi:hypothetical protein
MVEEHFSLLSLRYNCNELDILTFLMNDFNCREQPKKQEDFARRKEVKEEDKGNGNEPTGNFQLWV